MEKSRQNKVARCATSKKMSETRILLTSGGTYDDALAYFHDKQSLLEEPPTTNKLVVHSCCSALFWNGKGKKT